MLMKTRNKDKFNRMSPQGKGNPSDQGKSKAEVKRVSGEDDLKRANEIADKYLKEEDEPDQNVRQENPNRNSDKQNIDKPSYGSSK
jgi:hypothetical protein